MANKKINNSNSSNTRAADPSNEPVKHRGRPKGSTDKTERKKRIDREQITGTDNGENSKMIQYTMALASLPKIDYENVQAVKERVNDFFSICSAYDYKPSVAALAVSLGMNRFKLFDILNGRNDSVKSKESLLTIKAAYDTINSLYELYMNNGKINPVAGIFLMKNNMGYKDTTDYVISNNQETQLNLSDIANRAGLLSE